MRQTDQLSEGSTVMADKYETPVLEVLDIGEDVILTSGEEPDVIITDVK